jgi:HEAT repeat protein
VIELVRSFDRSQIARHGEVDGPFERARAELVRLHETSTPVLAELLAVKDGVVAYLAADLLAEIGAPAAAPVAAQLDDERPEVRRRAAELLGRLPHAGAAEAEIEHALARLLADDEAWIVRAQAAGSLAARARLAGEARSARPRLETALDDPDPAVVIEAIRGLAALGDRQAIPALVKRLDRAAQQLDWAGMRELQRALRRLSGAEGDLDVRGWWQWWQEHAGAPDPR